LDPDVKCSVEAENNEDWSFSSNVNPNESIIDPLISIFEVDIVSQIIFPFDTENVSVAIRCRNADDFTKLSVKQDAERQPCDVICVFSPRVCNVGVIAVLFNDLLNATDDNEMDKRINTLNTTNIVIKAIRFEFLEDWFSTEDCIKKKVFF
jgi:hypothetical protein